MRTLATFAKWLFMLCLLLLLLPASIGWAVNSLWLYNYGFQKYGVSQTTGLARTELEKAATGLINYFNSNDEYVTITVVKNGKPFELFTREERIHFRDVKELIWLDYRILLATLIYVLGYALVCILWHRPKHWRWLARSVMGGSGITLALMLAAGIGVMLNFDQLFLHFHLLAFTNQYWSAEGYMLMLFPGGFWYDAAVFCASATAAAAVILGGLAAAYLKKGPLPGVVVQ